MSARWFYHSPLNGKGDFEWRGGDFPRNDTSHEWWKIEFPAIISNCAKCHQGRGSDVDNWKKVPSRDACGSCHDTVNFDKGTKHAGGPQTTDTACATCHPASGTSTGITEAHDWTTKDPRNIPEFTVDLSVSRPANITYFTAGESPVVTVVLKDLTCVQRAGYRRRACPGFI